MSRAAVNWPEHRVNLLPVGTTARRASVRLGWRQRPEGEA